jgi:hypothetical protein
LINDHLSWSYLLIELGNYVLTLALFVYAWRKGRELAFFMLASIVFGWYLEYKTVTTEPILYEYHRWIVALPGPIPLGIAVGWGVVFIAVWQTAKALEFPMWVRPLFCALAGIGIDLVMDPAFVYMKFWTFTDPGQWFDIPWINFIGWFSIATSYVLMVELGQKWFPPGGPGAKGWLVDLAVPFVAIVPASLILLVMVGIYKKIVAAQLPFLTETDLVLATFSFSGLVVAWFLPHTRRDRAFDPMIVLVPVYLGGTALIATYLSDVHEEYLPLGLVAPAIFVITVVVFALPYFDQLRATRRGDGPSAK